MNLYQLKIGQTELAQSVATASRSIVDLLHKKLSGLRDQQEDSEKKTGAANNLSKILDDRRTRLSFSRTLKQVEGWLNDEQTAQQNFESSAHRGLGLIENIFSELNTLHFSLADPLHNDLKPLLPSDSRSHMAQDTLLKSQSENIALFQSSNQQERLSQGQQTARLHAWQLNLLNQAQKLLKKQKIIGRVMPFVSAVILPVVQTLVPLALAGVVFTSLVVESLVSKTLVAAGTALLNLGQTFALNQPQKKISAVNHNLTEVSQEIQKKGQHEKENSNQARQQISAEKKNWAVMEKQIY